MRKLVAGLVAASILTSPVFAATAAPAKAPAYKTPHLPDGRPDLEGPWTNATITPLERNPQYGTRLVLTPEETAKLEGARAEQVAFGNRPTDPNSKYDPKAACDLPGFRETACGYNAGWTDPGTLIMRVGGEPRSSFITSTPNGRIPPRLASAPAMARQGTGDEAGGRERPGLNDNPETRGPPERCLFAFGNISGPVMVPSLYNNTYRIQQGTDTVALEVEMVHDVRLVRLNSKHRTDGIRPYMGDSIGWYEGDTLVIETTNYPAYTNLRGSSANLKVTERLKRVSPTRMLYQFKVEDPTVWAQPWGGEYEFSATEPLFEYACHEGNYGLEGILAGARAEDKLATSTAPPQAAR